MTQSGLPRRPNTHPSVPIRTPVASKVPICLNSPDIRLGGPVAEEDNRANATAARDTGGLAMDFAMEEARSDPSLRSHVAAFLDDQRALIAEQLRGMQEQSAPQLRHFLLAVWEKRMPAPVSSTLRL